MMNLEDQRRIIDEVDNQINRSLGLEEFILCMIVLKEWKEWIQIWIHSFHSYNKFKLDLKKTKFTLFIIGGNNQEQTK